MTVTTINHSTSGASCTINSFGATVTSFKDSSGQEQLFLSKKAVTDGSKAIRGGIPIVFPIFGPSKPPSTMPQHGFGRVNEWTVLKTFDEPAAAGAVYELKLADATAGRGTENLWCPDKCKTDGTDCILTYEIRLEAKQLTTTLIIKNSGSDTFDFQALLHTYLAANSAPSTVSVHGLGGYAITDKVSGDSGHVQSYDEDVKIDGETDRVYIHPDDHPTVHAVVQVGRPSQKVRIEAAGMVDETPTPVSAVVWNPGPTKAAAMSDFGDDEFNDMICVEPGIIGHLPLLAPGKEGRLTQSIIVVDE